MPAIDDFDIKILSELQSNGRLSNQDLSELIGLSASQCSRRRIALEQAGLILGYHARLSPHALNTQMVALIEVRLTSHIPSVAEAFELFVRTEVAVVDAFKTTGEADYTLKAAVGDLSDLNDLMGRLSASTAIGHLKTSVVLERLKEAGDPLRAHFKPEGDFL